MLQRVSLVPRTSWLLTAVRHASTSGSDLAERKAGTPDAYYAGHDRIDATPLQKFKQSKSSGEPLATLVVS